MKVPCLRCVAPASRITFQGAQLDDRKVDRNEGSMSDDRKVDRNEGSMSPLCRSGH